MVEAQAKQKRCYDEQTSDALTFDEGDVVYLHVPRVQTKKLSRLWKGPFVVEHVYDAVDAKIRPVKGGSAQRVHMNRLKPCYRSPVASQDEELRRQRGDPVSESEGDEGEGDFEVILEGQEARRVAGRRQEETMERANEPTDINAENVQVHGDEELESEPDSEEEADEGGVEAAPMVEARPRRNA